MIAWKKKSDKIMIQSYRGYSSPHRLYLTGRVLEDERISSTRSETFLTTIRNNFKRWESDEISKVPVTLEIDQEIYQEITDREGYFTFDEKEGLEQAPTEIWKEVKLMAKFTHRNKLQLLEQRSEILTPSGNAKFGIISDIDDTILHTQVLYRMKMIRNTFFSNPYQRLALPGMSEWINGLRIGPDGKSQNPIFYVSKSPRNIFDYLSTFLSINQFPKGPILLRDIGRTGYRPEDYAGHKEEEIERIFRTFPNLPFIMIGDIAGHDPQIYHHFKEKYPSQVLAIYLRNIQHKKRIKQFRDWQIDLNNANMLLIQNSLEGAQHAFEQGWINANVLTQLQTKS